VNVIASDDLALLGAGFESAMVHGADPGSVVSTLFELGWADLLVAAPDQAAATAFGPLGATGSSAGIIDDVIARALGLEVSLDTSVLLPAPGRWGPPARRSGTGGLEVDGLVTTRHGDSQNMVIGIANGGSTEFVTVATSLVTPSVDATIDPADSVRRVRCELPSGVAAPLDATGSWGTAVAAARVALAHQLLGASRTMLEQARRHALDRVQFGRAVSSFQAVRHKLAEALVQIEGATAVVESWSVDGDPLIAALSKSLAGQAARLTATNAQQVLAGIGFTTDHPFHLYLKRTLVVDLLFGSTATLPGEIGRELLARGEAPRLVEL